VRSSEEYKREIMKDLAQGNVESLDNVSTDSTQEYQTFDDFAQRTTTDQRRHLFNQSLQPERIPPSQMEPELQKAISQIKPNERDDVAKAFFKQLKERGLEDKRLEQQLNLSTHHPNRMTADDVSKLASFTYHNHPDVFREVLAEQPGIIKFLSNPIVAGIIGIAAAKWLGSRK
jgi:Glu-tRNA(Gln) amidotransferase subunit E-like FAD-binding protein